MTLCIPNWFKENLIGGTLFLEVILDKRIVKHNNVAQIQFLSVIILFMTLPGRLLQILYYKISLFQLIYMLEDKYFRRGCKIQ